jgi:hypothetical protein
VLRLIAFAVALALGSAAAAEPTAEPAPATMGPASPDLPRLPSRLDDGTRVALPPMVVQQDRAAADRRPMYIGAGLIALALVFWWNRRRRDRFDREDADSSDSPDR